MNPCRTSVRSTRALGKSLAAASAVLGNLSCSLVSCSSFVTVQWHKRLDSLGEQVAFTDDSLGKKVPPTEAADQQLQCFTDPDADEWWNFHGFCTLGGKSMPSRNCLTRCDRDRARRIAPSKYLEASPASICASEPNQHGASTSVHQQIKPQPGASQGYGSR